MPSNSIFTHFASIYTYKSNLCMRHNERTENNTCTPLGVIHELANNYTRQGTYI